MKNNEPINWLGSEKKARKQREDDAKGLAKTAIEEAKIIGLSIAGKLTTEKMFLLGTEHPEESTSVELSGFFQGWTISCLIDKMPLPIFELKFSGKEAMWSVTSINESGVETLKKMIVAEKEPTEFIEAIKMGMREINSNISETHKHDIKKYSGAMEPEEREQLMFVIDAQNAQILRDQGRINEALFHILHPKDVLPAEGRTFGPPPGGEKVIKALRDV